jgi:hypothetical protein
LGTQGEQRQTVTRGGAGREGGRRRRRRGEALRGGHLSRKHELLVVVFHAAPSPWMDPPPPSSESELGFLVSLTPPFLPSAWGTHPLASVACACANGTDVELERVCVRERRGGEPRRARAALNAEHEQRVVITVEEGMPVHRTALSLSLPACLVLTAVNESEEEDDDVTTITMTTRPPAAPAAAAAAAVSCLFSSPAGLL